MLNLIHEDMSSEIIEAIHLTYEDEPDIELSCYYYLYKKVANKILRRKLENILLDKDVCLNCGSILIPISYIENHYELENNRKEKIYQKICPYCKG